MKSGKASLPVWQIPSRRQNSLNARSVPNHRVRAACDHLCDRQRNDALDVICDVCNELGRAWYPDVDEFALLPVPIGKRLEMNQLVQSVAASAQTHPQQFFLIRCHVRRRYSTSEAHASEARLEHRILPSAKGCAEIHAQGKVDLACDEAFKRKHRTQFGLNPRLAVDIATNVDSEASMFPFFNECFFGSIIR